MERRRDGGDSGGDIPTEHDESLDGAEEDSIFTLDLIDLWVRVYFPVSRALSYKSLRFIRSEFLTVDRSEKVV